MNYHCEILADSIGPHGHRLTTFEITFPRMVLADMTRHRMLSYSFESTRAVPVERRIEQVRNAPFIPTFRERVVGMQRGKPLTGMARTRAASTWLEAAHSAADAAEKLLNVEKGLAGRILEPYCWITGIVSGTEWENFFNLRCTTQAQYELEVIATAMRDSRAAASPAPTNYGEWHLPLVTPDEIMDAVGVGVPEAALARVSAGRCASVSYLRHHGDANTAEVASGRWNNTLAPSAHWSPGEHPAECVRGVVGLGNYTGWKQLRKFYDGEAVAKDPA